MAIRHIRVLARELASKYEKVNTLCLDFGASTAGVCLSQQDMEEFAAIRSAADAHLSLLSVAFSAAVSPAKFATLKGEVSAPVNSFSNALAMLLNDASKPDAPEQTQQLIGIFSAQLKKARETQLILAAVEHYKNLPNSSRKCSCQLARYASHLPHKEQGFVGEFGLHMSQVGYPGVAYLFDALNSAIGRLSDYVAESKKEITPAVVGDLEE